MEMLVRVYESNRCSPLLAEQWSYLFNETMSHRCRLIVFPTVKLVFIIVTRNANYFGSVDGKPMRLSMRMYFTCFNGIVFPRSISTSTTISKLERGIIFLIEQSVLCALRAMSIDAGHYSSTRLLLLSYTLRNIMLNNYDP